MEDYDIEGMSNALCEIQKPTVRKRLIQKGIRQAEKFSWVSMAQIVKETLLNQIVSSFQLTEINYLLLADWETEEEELTLELANVMFHLANQDLSTIVTLVVDITGISEEEANFFFSSVMMNLMMETELDLEDKLNLTFVNNLNEREWQELLPNITGKITLAQENPNINIPNFEDIISLNSNGNNYVLFPDW